MNQDKQNTDPTPPTAGQKTDEVKVEHLPPEENQSGEQPPVAGDKKPEEKPVEDVTEPAAPEPPTEPEENWEDRFLRLAAEFDNYKKRTAREYLQIIKAILLATLKEGIQRW